jgi:uncharacterized protein (DUF2267 family)
MNVVARMLKKAEVWIGETAEELGWDDHDKAMHALRAVLHALRDRLPLHEAVHLGAQLPTVIRGLYYEGWVPRQTPPKVRTREEFLERVRRPFGPSERSIDPEALARAVFAVIARHVTEGEVSDVRHTLPKPIATLWPD